MRDCFLIGDLAEQAEGPLGVESMSPLHSSHMRLCPGDCDKLHAAWVHDLSPLPIFWLSAGWGTATIAYSMQGTLFARLSLQPHAPQLQLPFAAGKKKKVCEAGVGGGAEWGARGGELVYPESP